MDSPVRGLEEHQD
jgi:hypothetical protein